MDTPSTLAPPFSCAVTGVRQAVSRQMGVPLEYPVSSGRKSLFSAWSMLVCLAGLSASPQAGRGKRLSVAVRHVP